MNFPVHIFTCQARQLDTQKFSGNKTFVQTLQPVGYRVGAKVAGS